MTRWVFEVSQHTSAADPLSLTQLVEINFAGVPNTENLVSRQWKWEYKAMGAITFFPGERFCNPSIPTFTEQFHTISHKWTLAQTL